MLQPSPEFVPKTPPAVAPNILELPPQEEFAFIPRLYSPDCWVESVTKETETNEPTESDIAYVHRRHRASNFGFKAIACTLLVAESLAGAYMVDVHQTMNATADNKPSIRVMYPAVDEENAHKATITYDGFNTTGAHNFTGILGDSFKNAFGGAGWSVQYNNATLNSAQLTGMLNEKIKEEDITAVDVIAHSIGGVPAVDFAVETINNTWVDVESFTFVAGAADFHSLTPATKNELSTAKSVAWVPYIEHSGILRRILEGYFYREDIKKNWTRTIDGINTRFNNGDVTTNQFIASQINSISDANIPEKILSINNDKFKTTFNYIKLSSDSVVNNDESAEKICAAVIEKNMNCNIFEVNSHHGQYYMDLDEYNKVFEEISHIVKPLVEREQARHALNLYGYYQEETLTLP